MTAYVIARVEITDREQYQKYMQLTPSAIAEHGGRFISRGGDVVTLEGPEETRRVVLIEFPTLAAAQTFYESESYRTARQLRAGAAHMELVAVTGE